MFGTIGYLMELSVSIYFFCVVALFIINVCEFMPLTKHDGVEEKIHIRIPKPLKPVDPTRDSLISDETMMKLEKMGKLDEPLASSTPEPEKPEETSPPTKEDEPLPTEENTAAKKEEPTQPIGDDEQTAKEETAVEEEEKHLPAKKEESPTTTDEPSVNSEADTPATFPLPDTTEGEQSGEQKDLTENTTDHDETEA